MEADLQILQNDRVEFYSNLLLEYLNVNSLPNKVTDIKIIFKDLSLDYFVLTETKLDDSFPTTQFTLEGYEIWSRKDRDKYDWGLIEFVKMILFVEQPENTSDKLKCICSKFTILKNKWMCFNIYRLLVSSNLPIFFKELANILNKAGLK